MKDITERPLWVQWLVIILAPVIGLALGVAVAMLLKIDQADYGNFVVNLIFFLACIAVVWLFRFSQEELGLKVIPEKMKLHVVLSLGIFAVYMLFYVFAIRISAFRPFSSGMVWQLLGYLVVVVAEELYCRGAFYGFLEKRYSARTALVASSLLFGFLHVRQGVRGMLLRTATGWLWGSVRYSTGMIFILIFRLASPGSREWV